MTLAVIEQEKERHAYWAGLGLPDPIEVEVDERVTRNVFGVTDFVSPRRAVLDATSLNTQATARRGGSERDRTNGRRPEAATQAP